MNNNLFQRFPWLVPSPFGEVVYDSKKKAIYIGEPDKRTHEIRKSSRNIGLYRVYLWEFRTQIWSHGKYRNIQLAFVVDTQTHEVGMVNPFVSDGINFNKELGE